jgi:hypothetical protein
MRANALDLRGLGVEELSRDQQVKVDGGSPKIILVVKGYRLWRAIAYTGGAAGAGYVAGKRL